MIQKGGIFEWPQVGRQDYKDEPGTWMAVTRRTLLQENQTKFEVRYFEVAPEGYISFEKHEHEHCVVVLRGAGRVRLDDQWHDIATNDTVHVGPSVPHQFINNGNEPFGILCIVDKERDRPVLLDHAGHPRTSD